MKKELKLKNMTIGGLVEFLSCGAGWSSHYIPKTAGAMLEKISDKKEDVKIEKIITDDYSRDGDKFVYCHDFEIVTDFRLTETGTVHDEKKPSLIFGGHENIKFSNTKKGFSIKTEC